MKRHTFIAAEFLLAWILLAGCSGSARPEIQIGGQAAFAAAAPTSLPTTPAPIPQIVGPTATAWAFELVPTSTPLPTWTVVPTVNTFEYYASYGPSGFPADVNPLTGKVVADPALLNRRPMAIKVTNFPRSVRPQSGLTLADHVYEYYLEDGLTRFIGVFYGNDVERVGPVRSARLFDEHIVRMYKAAFAFGYADDKVYERFAESDLKNLLVVEREDNCPPMCRIGPKNSYLNLFTNTQELSRHITERGVENGRQNLDGLYFQTAPPTGGANGDRITIRYSQTSHNRWDFDPATSRYLRMQEIDLAPAGQPEVFDPLLDSLTMEQVAADNLIVLFVPHGYFYKSSSTEIYEMAFIGQGRGLAFRDGMVYQILWRRDAAVNVVTLQYPSGSSYPLKPGNVWFEILGETSTTQELEDGWRFEFDIP